MAVTEQRARELAEGLNSILPDGRKVWDTGVMLPIPQLFTAKEQRALKKKRSEYEKARKKERREGREQGVAYQEFTVQIDFLKAIKETFYKERKRQRDAGFNQQARKENQALRFDTRAEAIAAQAKPSDINDTSRATQNAAVFAALPDSEGDQPEDFLDNTYAESEAAMAKEVSGNLSENEYGKKVGPVVTVTTQTGSEVENQAKREDEAKKTFGQRKKPSPAIAKLKEPEPEYEDKVITKPADQGQLNTWAGPKNTKPQANLKKINSDNSANAISGALLDQVKVEPEIVVKSVQKQMDEKVANNPVIGQTLAKLPPNIRASAQTAIQTEAPKVAARQEELSKGVTDKLSEVTKKINGELGNPFGSFAGPFGQIGMPFGNMLGSVVGKAVGQGPFTGALQDAVGGAVGSALGNTLGGPGGIKGALANAAQGAISNAIGNAAGKALGGSLGGLVGNAIGGAVNNAISGALPGGVGGNIASQIAGNIPGGIAGNLMNAATGGALGKLQAGLGLFQDLNSAPNGISPQTGLPAPAIVNSFGNTQLSQVVAKPQKTALTEPSQPVVELGKQEVPTTTVPSRTMLTYDKITDKKAFELAIQSVTAREINNVILDWNAAYSDEKTTAHEYNMKVISKGIYQNAGDLSQPITELVSQSNIFIRKNGVAETNLPYSVAPRSLVNSRNYKTLNKAQEFSHQDVYDKAILIKIDAGFVIPRAKAKALLDDGVGSDDLIELVAQLNPESITAKQYQTLDMMLEVMVRLNPGGIFIGLGDLFEDFAAVNEGKNRAKIEAQGVRFDVNEYVEKFR